MNNNSINYREYGKNETHEISLKDYQDLVCKLVKERK